MNTTTVDSRITLAPLTAADVDAADRVFRLAFGTMIGLPDPLRFQEGAEPIRLRAQAHPEGAFKAELDGELVGSAFVTRWGSLALFGPLSVHPEHWDRGIGRRLWEARMPLLERWGVEHAALFTRPDSTKHLHLYQRFGFWPGALTALTAREVGPAAGSASVAWRRASELAGDGLGATLGACRGLTEELLAGLDLGHEIRLVLERGVGDVVLLGSDAPEGFAVCHLGAGSEAGPGACYVKFGIVRPGSGAGARLTALLDAVAALAAGEGLRRLVAGVNTARHEAYRAILGHGQRPFLYGLAMHRPHEQAYDRPDAFVLDDWR